MIKKWKFIINNWINCYFDKTNQDECHVNIESLLTIISHLRDNLNLDESKSSLLEAHTVEEFILEKYPGFKFKNGSVKASNEDDIYIVASLLLYFVCVNSKDMDLKSAMCSKLSSDDQEIILKFSKSLMDCSPITCEYVEAAITEACGNEMVAMDTGHVRVPVAETPPALRSLHGEVRRLQAALDAERFDRNYLQEELSRTNLRVEKLLKDKEQYKQDIMDLKTKISLCCGGDNDGRQAEAGTKDSAKLTRQLEDMEERLVRTQEMLEEAIYERDGYKAKLEGLKQDRDKWLALSQQESARTIQLTEELETERRQVQSLKELINELRQHNRLNKMDSSLLECDDPDASVQSMAHNLSVCSEVCANIIEVQLEEERAKVAALKQQIEMLQKENEQLHFAVEEDNSNHELMLKEKDFMINNLEQQLKEQGILLESLRKDHEVVTLSWEKHKLKTRDIIEVKDEHIRKLNEHLVSLKQEFAELENVRDEMLKNIDVLVKEYNDEKQNLVALLDEEKAKYDIIFKEKDLLHRQLLEEKAAKDILETEKNNIVATVNELLREKTTLIDELAEEKSLRQILTEKKNELSAQKAATEKKFSKQVKHVEKKLAKEMAKFASILQEKESAVQQLIEEKSFRELTEKENVDLLIEKTRLEENIAETMKDKEELTNQFIAKQASLEQECLGQKEINVLLNHELEQVKLARVNLIEEKEFLVTQSDFLKRDLLDHKTVQEVLLNDKQLLMEEKNGLVKSLELEKSAHDEVENEKTGLCLKLKDLNEQHVSEIKDKQDELEKVSEGMKQLEIKFRDRTELMHQITTTLNVGVDKLIQDLKTKHFSNKILQDVIKIENDMSTVDKCDLLIHIANTLYTEAVVKTDLEKTLKNEKVALEEILNQKEMQISELQAETKQLQQIATDTKNEILKKNKNYNSAVENKQTEIQSLQQENKKLKNDLNNAKIQLDMQVHSMKELMVNNEIATDQLKQQYEFQIDNLNSMVSTLTDYLSAKTAELETAVNERDWLQHVIEENNKGIVSLEKEVEITRQSLEKVVNDFESEKLLLKNMLTNTESMMENQKVSLNNTISELTKANGMLQDEIRSIKGLIEKKTQVFGLEMREKETLLKSQEKELIELKQTKQDLEQQIILQKDALDKEIVSLRAEMQLKCEENRKLKDKYNKSNKIKTLKSQNKGLNQEVTDLKTVIQSKEDLIKNMLTEKNKLETAIRNHEENDLKLKSQNTELQCKIDANEVEFNSKVNQLRESLQMEAEEKKKLINKLNEKVKSVLQLEEKINMLLQEKHRLTAEKNDYVNKLNKMQTTYESDSSKDAEEIISLKKYSSELEKDNAKLNKVKTELEENIANLNKDNAKVNSDIVELEKNIAKSNEHNIKLEQTIVKLNGNKMELEKNIAKLNEDNLKLEHNIVKLNEDKAKLDKIIAKLNKENAKLDTNIAKLYNENTELEQEIVQLKEVNMELEQKIVKFNEDNSKLEQNIAILNEDNSKLEQNIAKLNEDNSILEQNFSKLNEDNSKLKQTIAKLNENNTNLEHNIAKLNEHNTKLEQNIAKLTEDNTKLIQNNANLNEGNTKLKQNIVKLKEDNTKLEHNIAKLNHDNSKLEQAIAKLNDDNTNLEHNITKLNEDNTKLEQNVAKLNEDNTKLLQDIANLNEDNTNLEQTIAKLNEDNTNFEHNIAKLNDNNSKLEQSISKLNEDNTKLEHNIAKLNEDHSKFEQTIAKLNEDNTKLKQNIATSNEDNLKLEQNIAKLNEDNTILEQNIAVLKVDNTKLVQNIANLNENNTKLEQIIAKLNVDNTKLEHNIAKLNENVTKLEQNNCKLNDDNTKLEQNIAQLKEVNIQLEQKIAQLKEASTILEQNIAKLDEDKIKYKQDIAKIKQYNAELIEESLKLKSDYAELVENCNEEKAAHEEFNNKISTRLSVGLNKLVQDLRKEDIANEILQLTNIDNEDIPVVDKCDMIINITNMLIREVIVKKNLEKSLEHENAALVQLGEVLKQKEVQIFELQTEVKRLQQVVHDTKIELSKQNETYATAIDNNVREIQSLQQENQSLTNDLNDVKIQLEVKVHSLKEKLVDNENLTEKLKKTYECQIENLNVMVTKLTNYLKDKTIELETLRKEKDRLQQVIEENNKAIKCLEEEVKTEKLNQEKLLEDFESERQVIKNMVIVTESVMEDQKAAFCNTISEQAKTIDMIQDENRAIKKEIEIKRREFETKLQEEQTAFELLHRQLKQLEQEKKRMTNENILQKEVFEKEIKSLKSEIVKKEAEIGKLNEEMNFLATTNQSYKESAASLANENNELKIKNDEIEVEFRNKLERLTASLQEQIDNKKDLNIELDKTTNSISSMESQLKDLKDKIKTLEQEKSDLIVEKDTYVAKVDEIQSTFETNLSHLSEEITKSKKHVSELVEEIDKLKKDNMAYENEIDKLKKNNVAYEQEIDKLNKANKAYEQEINKLKKDSLASEQEIDKLKNNNMSYEQEINKLKKDNIAYEQEIDKLKNNNTSYEQEINQLKKDNMAYEQEINKLKNENMAYEQEINKLKKDNMAYEQEIIKLQKDNMAYEQEINKLKNDNMAYDHEINKLKKDNMAYEHEIDKLKKENMAYELEIDKLNKNNIVSEQEIAKWKNDKNELSKEIDKLKIHNTKLLEEINNMKIKNTGLLEKISKSENSNAELVNTIEEKIIELELAIKQEQEKHKKLQDDIAVEKVNLVNKCDILQSYHDKAEKELEERQKEIVSLQKQVQTLQTKVDLGITESAAKDGLISKMSKEKDAIINEVNQNLLEEKVLREKYQKDFEEKIATICELKKNLNDLNNERKALSILKRENEELIKVVGQREAFVVRSHENTSSRKYSGQSAEKELRDIHHQVDNTSDIIHSSIESLKTITDLEKIIHDKNRTITTLQSDVTYLKTLMAESENKLLDVTKELEVSKENCQQLSAQLKKIVQQKNEEITELKKQVSKMSVTENRATQIIKVSAKYQAIILKRIAEIKSSTVLKELTNFGNTNTNSDSELRRSLTAGSITMEDLENFLETTERHLKKCSEKQLAIQKEKDRLIEVNRIHESEIINLKKFLTELSVCFQTFSSVKDLYAQKLSRVISVQRTVRREILSLDGHVTDTCMLKLERGYAAVMQDLAECAMNLERWVERCIGRTISSEKIKQAFMSDNERTSLAPSSVQNAGLEVQLDELENSFQRLLEEVSRAQKGEGAKDAQAVTVMEVRAEYEDKLNRMKAKMKQLYTEQIAVFKEKQKEEIAMLERELARARDTLSQSSRAYEEHIRSLTTELWSVGEKFLMQKDEANYLRRKQRSGSLMSLQHVHSSGFVPNQEDAGRPSDTQSLRSLPVNNNNNGPKREGRGLHMSDEEGEVFDNRYLRELATPRRERDPARLSELRWRNSLCPPHLKSSYPAETQFAPIADEDEIKAMGGPGPAAVRSQRKEVGIIAYKKPGPPTPSKQAGRLSATDSELRESLRVEADPHASRKTSTPSRIRSLFRSTKAEASEGTPRSRRLSNIFRKK